MELISLHIPKTGGTALTTLLQSVYDSTELLLDYQDEIGRPDSRFCTDFEGWRRDNEQHIREIATGTRAVHGHFWAGKYLPYFAEARKILWLRDPARLLISAYFYWKRRPPRHPEGHLVYQHISQKDASAAVRGSPQCPEPCYHPLPQRLRYRQFRFYRHHGTFW